MRLTVAAVAATLVLASCGFRVEGVSCSKNGECPSGQCLDGVCLVGDPDAGLAGEDASAPGRDAAAPGRDAAAPGPDAALPGLDAGLPDTGNHAPKLEVESVPGRVPEGSLTPLVVKATDPDGDRVTLTWSERTGDQRVLRLASGQAVFVAPDVEVDTEYELEVSACDPLDACGRQKLKIVVDRPPQFGDAAKVEPAIVAPNGKVDVTVFPDDPGDSLTFTWKVAYGRGVVGLPATATTSPKVSFQVPNAGDQTLGLVVEACGLLPLCTSQAFTVTVQDPQATTGAYVSSSTGSDEVDVGKGTRVAPWKSIARGLQEAKDRGLPQVFVAEGTYEEDVEMVKDVAVECGWNPTDWTRTAQGETVIRPRLPAGLRFLAGQHARLDGCTVRPKPETVPVSEPVTAVSVVNATAMLVGCTLDPSPETPPTNSQGLFVAVDANLALPPSAVALSKVRSGNGTGERKAAVVKGFARLEAWGVTFGDPSQTGATKSSGVLVRDSGYASLTLSSVYPGAATTSAAGVVVEHTAEAQVELSTVHGGKAPSTTGIQAGGNKVVVKASRVDGGEASTGIAYGIAGQSKDLQVTGNPLVSGGTGASTYGVKVTSGIATVSNNLRIDGGAGNTTMGIAFHGGTGSVLRNLLVRGSADSPATRPSSSYGLSLKGAGVKVEDNLYVHGGEGAVNSTGIELRQTIDVVLRGNTVFGGKAPTSWAVTDRLAGTVSSTNLRVEANLLAGGDATDATISGGLLLEATTGTLLNNRVWGGVGPSATALHVLPGGLDVFNNAFLAGGKTGAMSTAHAIRVVAGAVTASTASRWHNNILDGGRLAAKRWAVYEQGAFTPASFRSNDFYPDPEVNYVAWRTTGAKDLKVSDLAGMSAAFADNFAEVPQFVDEAKGDLHLGPTSPCRDRGVPVDKGAALTDMDGEERPKTGPTDVGPDEVP